MGNQQSWIMEYKVNVQKTTEVYAVSVPGIPGCWSQGKTEQEALENIRESLLALPIDAPAPPPLAEIG